MRQHQSRTGVADRAALPGAPVRKREPRAALSNADVDSLVLLCRLDRSNAWRRLGFDGHGLGREPILLRSGLPPAFVRKPHRCRFVE
ncbi:MAG TPA: hypothetical protein VFN79_06505 [Steroidobacteraceae bacterium]|nr:hypothetical protein [Steroidobacteraceae bacterium]